MHDDIFAELDRFFGDYAGPSVRIEQTVIDADIDRARGEERRWRTHLDRWGDHEIDRRAAECEIADAPQWVDRLRATPPNRRLVQRLECNLDAGTCRHSARDWYLHGDVATDCGACGEVPGPIARYTLLVWRERAEAA
jgi:hypothetical protein